MKTLIQSFEAAVVAEPAGLYPGQLLQQIAAAVLQMVTRPDENKLSEAAALTAEAARGLKPAKPESHDIWKAWYAGQLHAFAAMCRLVLRIEIPQKIRHALTPNKSRILLTLGEHDDEMPQALLRSMIEKDASYFTKQMKELETLGLIDRASEKSQSWVRLTPLGRRAISDARLRPLLDRLARTPEVTATIPAPEVVAHSVPDIDAKVELDQDEAKEMLEMLDAFRKRIQSQLDEPAVPPVTRKRRAGDRVTARPSPAPTRAG